LTLLQTYCQAQRSRKCLDNKGKWKQRNIKDISVRSRTRVFTIVQNMGRICMIVSSHLTEVVCYIKGDRVVTCILIVLGNRTGVNQQQITNSALSKRKTWKNLFKSHNWRKGNFLYYPNVLILSKSAWLEKQKREYNISIC
jgi:hypothetical protein